VVVAEPFEGYLGQDGEAVGSIVVVVVVVDWVNVRVVIWLRVVGGVIEVLGGGKNLRLTGLLVLERTCLRRWSGKLCWWCD
jgi:hypothetical protein